MVGRESIMSTKLNFNNDFDKIYGYDGDLGAIYSKDKCKFILWAPTAENVQLAIDNLIFLYYNISIMKIVLIAKLRI